MKAEIALEEAQQKVRELDERLQLLREEHAKPSTEDIAEKRNKFEKGVIAVACIMIIVVLATIG